MKLLKKMNKGLILTIIVLVLLIIYLVQIEVRRNAEKPQIEKMCEEYIALINKYVAMPEDNQKLYQNIQLKEEEKMRAKENASYAIKNNMQELEKELEEKMIDNSTAISMQKKAIEEFVEDSNDIFTSVITKVNKEITKIKKMVFDKDQVTVVFSTNTELETKYLEQETLEENKELTKKDSFEMIEESITLQRVDGSWKVVYADLDYQNYKAGFSRTTTINF